MNDISITDIKNKIYTIRGKQVMFDLDLAELYGIETKVLNQAEKRNISRFPLKYCFVITREELLASRSQNVTLNNARGHNTKYLPHVFTESEVAMLSAVLKTQTAVNISIHIMDAFVAMRHYLADNAAVFQRLDRVELKQSITDKRVDQIFKQLEQPKPNSVNIFFKGQMWDALSCIEEIISKAKEEIILIDGYVDKSTLDVLSKKKNKIPVRIP